MPRRTLVLIDGEHYPPVVHAAVAELRAGGRLVVGAALLGGSEKLGGTPAVPLEQAYGVPSVVAAGSPLPSLLAALAAFAPDEVVDLSDSAPTRSPSGATW